MYVLDVISDRLWTDNPLCRPYCMEIAQVFGTVKPKTSSPTILPLQSHKSESDPIGKQRYVTCGVVTILYLNFRTR